MSQVELLESAPTDKDGNNLSGADTVVEVVKAEGQKCDRCWNYSVHVGESAEHPLLCERCVSALAEEF